jgi:uncharacterized membrane protein YfcA
MDALQIGLLVAGGAVAGVVNTLAGGGSLLTVPLLVMAGLPGTLANGTNRVGVLLQNVVAVWGFRAEGVSELRSAVPLLVPLGIGSVLGAAGASRLSDAAFERVFAVVMLVLLVPMLRGSARSGDEAAAKWSPTVTAGVFFAIGVYGGAFQAGVGIVLLFALNRSGMDLVRANALKAVLIAALTAVAVPVFILENQVAWLPAAVLAAGFALGAAGGARLAVRGGERVIRPVLAASVIALSGRMLGLY